jgi:hypothetical protein
MREIREPRRTTRRAASVGQSLKCARYAPVSRSPRRRYPAARPIGQQADVVIIGRTFEQPLQTGGFFVGELGAFLKNLPSCRGVVRNGRQRNIVAGNERDRTTAL